MDEEVRAKATVTDVVGEDARQHDSEHRRRAGRTVASAVVAMARGGIGPQVTAMQMGISPRMLRRLLHRCVLGTLANELASRRPTLAREAQR